MTRFPAVAFAAIVGWVPLQSQSVAEDDLLEKAINYLFTGRTDPKDGPEFVDRKSCTVLIPDPRNNRVARYYLSRFRMDDASIINKYSGSHVIYELDVRADDAVVEYLTPDKASVIQGYRSAQIPLPGDIQGIKKAIQIISAEC